MIIFVTLFLIAIVMTYPKWSYKQFCTKMKLKSNKEKHEIR